MQFRNEAATLSLWICRCGDSILTEAGRASNYVNILLNGVSQQVGCQCQLWPAVGDYQHIQTYTLHSDSNVPRIPYFRLMFVFHKM